MLINSDTVTLAFKGFQTKFSDAFVATEVDWPKVAKEVPSQAADETYGWLGQWPCMREWPGRRVVKNLSARGFTIRNRTFEATISVARTDFEDDRLGMFGPYEFQAEDKGSDDNTFLQDDYLYGIRARANAGFGLWQLAWGSKQTLNAANYAIARAAMAGPMPCPTRRAWCRISSRAALTLWSTSNTRTTRPQRA